MSLYERLGRQAAIRTAVDDSHERVVRHLVAPRTGMAWAGRTSARWSTR
jgi:hypothetical protein